jgi:hypothetical protein
VPEPSSGDVASNDGKGGNQPGDEGIEHARVVELPGIREEAREPDACQQSPPSEDEADEKTDAHELVVEDSSGEPFEVVNVVGREDAIQQPSPLSPPRNIGGAPPPRDPSARPRGSYGRILDDIRLNARIRRLPASQVDAQFPTRLPLVTRLRNENLKVVRAALLRDAIGPTQEVLQASAKIRVADEHVQDRKRKPGSQ